LSASSQLVPVSLTTAQNVYIEVTSTSPEEDVAFNLAPFEEFASALAGIASSLVDSFQQVKPKKAVVEFGCEVGYESGKLTAILVKGAGKANFKVSLEWGD